jgi:hypothetical protein
MGPSSRGIVGNVFEILRSCPLYVKGISRKLSRYKAYSYAIWCVLQIPLCFPTMSNLRHGPREGVIV